jgi:hypothetical protein
MWISEPHRLIARAAAGDREALVGLAADPELADGVAPHGLAPLLYGRSHSAAVGGPGVEAWHRELLRSAGWWLRADRALASIDGSLAQAGVRWLPIKGADTGTRLFGRREDRPCSDLDLLVRREDLSRARSALESRGWKGDTSREVEDFLSAEGYNWAAADDGGVRLELHYRLWGFVGQGLAEEVWTGATPDPTLGRTAHRVSLHHAFVLGATHAWVHPGPRRLVYWWELFLLGEMGGSELASAVSLSARRWGLELPVGLGARYAAELWGEATCAEIADDLLRRLRVPERIVRRGAERWGMDWLTLHCMYLARLLSGRPSRMGWRAAWRRVWAHPGAVEEATPSTWPRWGRRVYLAAQGVGLSNAAERLRRTLDRHDRGQTAGPTPGTGGEA